ncbi:MAG: recombinase family protein [Firmicutes bacterium]|nr:recombinase family protein [Bacillota bacterium]
MRKCAIYARVSDESQVKGESTEHQISVCKEIARRRSLESGDTWLTPDELVYVDEGITGTSLVKRAKVQRLLQDAQNHCFEVVLFKGISRFARDTVDALLMLRNLMACGVHVVSLEENFDSQRDNAEFVFTIHSALAQAESEKTAIRVRMGASQKAQQGKWNGRAPDGYVLNSDTKRLEIDPEFGAVIRDIFTMYGEGHGVRSIAHILNEKGLRTKQGNWWTQRHIARLLRNPAYVGDVAYGRRVLRTSFPDPEDPLKRSKVVANNPDASAIVICRDAHPALVSRSLFATVAARLQSRKQEKGQIGKAHLLTKGLATCSCGSSMTIKYNGHGTAYYHCLGQKEKGKAFCQQRYWRADALEAAVLQAVKVAIADVVTLQNMQVHIQVDGGIERKLHETKEQIAGLMRKSDLLFDAYARGNLSEEQFTHVNQTLRAQIASRKGDEEALCVRLRDEKENFGQDLHEGLQVAMDELLSTRCTRPDLARKLLQVLLKRIVITYTGIELSYVFKEPPLSGGSSLAP